jgi:hypothetical protein
VGGGIGVLLAIIGWVYHKMTSVRRRKPPDAEQGTTDIRPPKVMIDVLTVGDNIRPR